MSGENLIGSSIGNATHDIIENELNSLLQSNDIVHDVVIQLKDNIIPAYSDNTNVLLMMNNSYNSAAYISGDLKSKQQHAESLNKQSRSGIHTMRNVYMQKQYTIGYTRFLSGVVQSLVVIVCVIGILISLQKPGKIPSKQWLIIGCLVIAGLFLLVLAAIIKNNMTRRPDDWSKFYFFPSQPTK